MLKLNKTCTYALLAVGLAAALPVLAADSTTLHCSGKSWSMQLSIEGNPSIDAWFNINRFTGDLIVSPTEKGKKIIFMGSCKSAKPLF
jgi:hypothetical protein